MNKLKLLFAVIFLILTAVSIYVGFWINAIISLFASSVWVFDIRKDLKNK